MEYISRKDAMKGVAKLPALHGSEGAWVHQQDALNVLEKMPAADVVERKRGKWIKWGSEVKCDQCNLCNLFAKPFCPNCGVGMTNGES